MSDVVYSELSKDEIFKLAELGIAEAQVEYGYRLLKNSSQSEININSALKWFNLSSNQGNADAMFNLATMYKMGVGVERNLAKAFQLYKQSAEKGLSAAKYFLGEMYRYGMGTDVNEEMALKWITDSHSVTEELVSV